jgi:predicted  nucleic acid-binding Zn-ribbon protein
MRISQAFFPLIAGALLLTGCGNKQPATNAVTQAEAALAPMRDDAARFAPDELKAADATLTKMKDNLANSDYNAVVEDVPKFNAEVKTLQENVVQKQTLAAAAQNEWETLNAEVPKSVEAIQVRVDGLKGQRLPKEISKETYETAKADLETMKATWTEATAAATAGNTTEAADKGRTVAAKAEELKAKLGVTTAVASAAPTMTPPTGADIAPTN